MKTTHLTPTVWLGIAALAASAWAQDAAPAAANPPAPAPATSPGRGGRGPRGAETIAFNFRGAPLETVLNYMSEAAGFIIVLDTPVRGTVDMFSAQPVSREEAVQLLSFALNKNGYASVVQGRTIIISSKDDAKKKNLPIRTGNDPEEIPNTAEMVIQIIPLRHLDATTAARDLGSLLPGTASITPNADSNSLLVTDTNINLKQVVTLVNALDTSTDAITTMKIFRLKNADPYEMAALLTNLYSTAQTQNGRNGANTQFGVGGRGGLAGFGGAAGLAAAFGGAAGGNGGGRGGGGGGNGGRGGRGATTGARTVPVVAVADPRTLSVIVTAAKEQMPDIESMITQLDTASGRKQEVFTYTLENASVKQAEAMLKSLFPSSTVRNTTNTQVDPLATRADTNARSAAAAGQAIQLGSQSATTGTRTN
jgi:general secretion pathway protein D